MTRPPQCIYSTAPRGAPRHASALAIVTAALMLAGIASSQPKPAPRRPPKVGAATPGARGSGSVGGAKGGPPGSVAKATPAGSTAAAPPPPTFEGKPPGAFAVVNEKGPGIPIVIATQPWPATLLGAAPSPTPASSAAATKPVAPAATPSNDQEIALQELQVEADRYRKGASAYARSVGEIIRQRYEQKRKARLSSLQENIDRDSAELKRARMETMDRLKAFLAKYPDVPEHSPNAMFRLAALYEEQAVDNDIDPSDPQYTQKLRTAYDPAEHLYRDVIAKFPSYSQRPSVQFFLGALLSDTGRGPESQFVWRALVCSNHYKYPLPPPASPAEEKARQNWKDGIPPMPQDHEAAFWDKWRESHYMPPDTATTKGKKRGAPAVRARAGSNENEDTFRDTYPDDCVPLGAPASGSTEEPRFLAQTWWRIGEYHYSRGDETAEEEGYFGASPFRYNRALRAYEHAIKTSNETVKVFSLYKIAWTLYKQQRYNGARQKFLALLDYFDDKEKKTGQSGDQQMRQDAYDYSAASLTYLDMEGPGPNEPFIERDDVFGQFSGKELEKKLEIAIERVQDPKLVPQDKPWTSQIYKALAAEFDSDEVQLDAVRTYELVIKKWECDPEAPQFQNKIAQLYDLLAIKAESRAEKEEYAGKALEARTGLLNYVGKTKWTECNKNNPDAIHAAEALMNEGVKNAAGRHTALGRAYISRAQESSDGSKESRDNLTRAREEYRLAERGWTAYLAQDPDAADAYESRFWIADARHKIVLTTRNLGEPLDPKLVEEARSAAVDVRDSNLDDKYLRYAAYFGVDVADMAADEQFEAHVKSGCVPGVGAEKVISPVDEPGDACRPDSDKDSRETKRIWIRDVPPVVVRTLRERDDYVAKVPAKLDADRKAIKFEFEVADALYRYGRFEEATPRFEAIWNGHCGKDDYGFDAWYRLAVMSNLRGDTKRSVALVDAAKARPCATNEEQRLREKDFAEPTKIAALYKEADDAFEAAEKETDPKLRAQKFREAAAKYELALKTAPSRPEAPRGAINAAYCYKQVNEYKRAADVYRLFLDKYGREPDLIAYRDGDAKRGIKRDPEQFKTRLDYTKRALGELGRTYLQAFDYQAAAKHYDEVAGRTLLDEGERRDAAANAVILQSNLGNREKMLAARGRFLALRPSPAERAEVDFAVAEFEFKQWKQSPGDAGQRGRAATALDGFYAAYRAQLPAAKYVVDAAYDLAQLRRASGEAQFRDWYKKTADAFASYKTQTKDAVGSRESDYGAEAAYFFVNERIEREWDAVPGQPPKLKYEGSAEKVLKQLNVDDKKREQFLTALEDINKAYVSPKWYPVVLSREGTVVDTERTALARAKVEALDPAAAKKIKDAEEKAQKTLDDPKASEAAKAQAQQLLETADRIRQGTSGKWKEIRTQYFNTLDPLMIDRYARGYIRGKQFDVKDPMVTRSVQRLAFYTDQLDDAKMRQYLVQVEKDLPPFKYKDQMFKQSRPGALSAPTPNADTPLGGSVSAGVPVKAE